MTGTRADYGLLQPLVSKIDESNKLELQLYVTAIHLSDFYGHTIDDIAYPITAKVDMNIKEKNSKQDMLSSVSLGMSGFANSFKEHRPDLVVLLGDRIEQFAASLAALFLGIPIAHIHGGDISGGIDDCLRSMITKMASIHFPASNLSAKRIEALGEGPLRIHTVGAPGLDTVLALQIKTKHQLAKKYKLDSHKDWALVIYHSDTLSPDVSGEEMRSILETMGKTDLQKIVIYPNADAGSGLIISEIRKYEDRPDFAVFRNVEHKDFISIMANCALMAGNSSSALIEAPSFGVPVINVGSRQDGRERGKNVLDVIDVNDERLSEAISHALNDGPFLSKVRKRESPYGDGKASVRIVEVLESLRWNQILKKRFHVK